jgi:hypothetical protein
MIDTVSNDIFWFVKGKTMVKNSKNFLKIFGVTVLLCSTSIFCTSPEERSFWNKISEILFGKAQQKPSADQGGTADGSSPSFPSGLENHGEWGNAYFSSSDVQNFPWRNLLKKSADRIWYAWDYTNGATGFSEATPRAFLLLTQSASDSRVMIIDDIIIEQLTDRNVESCQELVKRLMQYTRKNGRFNSVQFDVRPGSDTGTKIFLLERVGFRRTADRKSLIYKV